MTYLLKTSQTIEKITDFIGKSASWLALPLVFVLCYEVIIRRIGSPTIWAFDMSYMIYGAHFMLVTAFALKYKAHVRTDIIYRRVSARLQGIVDSILYFVIFLPGVVLLFWASWGYFLSSWRIQESAITSPWMPAIWPLKFIMFFSIGLLLLQGISELIKAFYAAKYNKWPEYSIQDGLAIEGTACSVVAANCSVAGAEELKQKDTQESIQEKTQDEKVQETKPESTEDNEDNKEGSQKRGES